jgi:hypothetical protein
MVGKPVISAPRIRSWRPAWTKLVRPYLRSKIKTTKRVGGMAQVVEHFPSKCEALTSIPSTV